MSSQFNLGDSVFFAFEDGKTSLDSQRHPRMYKSKEQFDRKFPGGPAAAELVEYRPVVQGGIVTVDDVYTYSHCSHCRGDITPYVKAGPLWFCPLCGAELQY